MHQSRDLLIDMETAVTCDINTLTSGHVERCDCSPMHCWMVTHLYVFLHDALHMRLSADVIHLGRRHTILTSREDSVSPA
jgi:hypothetical protein